MVNGYYVYYYLGRSKTPYRLWICAHDEDEAKKLCINQAGYRHGYGLKVTISHVVPEIPVEPEIKVLGYWH